MRRLIGLIALFVLVDIVSWIFVLLEHAALVDKFPLFSSVGLHFCFTAGLKIATLIACGIGLAPSTVEARSAKCLSAIAVIGGIALFEQSLLWYVETGAVLVGAPHFLSGLVLLSVGLTFLSKGAVSSLHVNAALVMLALLYIANFSQMGFFTVRIRALLEPMLLISILRELVVSFVPLLGLRKAVSEVVVSEESVGEG